MRRCAVQKPGRWCAAHVRIAWEIHLGRLQQQQQKQHSGVADKDERRTATSSGTDSRHSDRPSENGRCTAQGSAMLFHRLIFIRTVFFTPRNRNTKIETHKLTDIGKSINTERKSSKSDGKVESQQNITGLVEVQRKLVESVQV